MIECRDKKKLRTKKWFENEKGILGFFVSRFFKFSKIFLISFLTIVCILGLFAKPEIIYTNSWKQTYKDPVGFFVLSPLFYLFNLFFTSAFKSTTKRVLEIIFIVLITKIFLFFLFFTEFTTDKLGKFLLEAQKIREENLEENQQKTVNLQGFWSAFLYWIASHLIPICLYYNLVAHPIFLSNKDKFDWLTDIAPWFITLFYIVLIFFSSFIKTLFLKNKLIPKSSNKSLLMETVKDTLINLLFFLTIRLFFLLVKKDLFQMSWSWTIFCSMDTVLNNFSSVLIEYFFKEKKNIS